MTQRTIVLVATLLCGASRVAWAEGAVAPMIFISNAIVTEGDSGLTPFTVDLSYRGYSYDAPSFAVRVSATPGTASEADYVFTTTEVSFRGDGGTQTVSGFIVGDIEPENDETFFLTATVIRNDGGFLPYLYSSGGTITIKDDDQARASKLHVEGATLLEGDFGLTKAEIRVVLEPASTSTVTVAYTTKDGTAIAKSDYMPITGTLTFAPGEVLKTITVDIIGDTTYEPAETFSVVLSQPTMALLGDMGTIVIANDDAIPTSIDTAPVTGDVETSTDGGAIVINLDAGVVTGTDAGSDVKLDKSDAQLDKSDAQPDKSDVKLPSPDTAPVPVTSNSDAATTKSDAHLNSGCSCVLGRGGKSEGALVAAGLAAIVVWRRRRAGRVQR